MEPSSSSSAASSDGAVQINGNASVPRSYSNEEPGPAIRRPSNETINIFGVEYPVIGRGGTVSAAASINASRTPTIESGRPGHAELVAAVAAVRDEPGADEALSRDVSREPTRQELTKAVQALASMTRSSSANGLPTKDAAGLPIIRRT